MNKITYAYNSAQNKRDDETPSVSACITYQEWDTLKFKCMTLDSQDDIPFKETDHPQGYNLILLHPTTFELFWGYTADFDFITENCKENNE